MQKPSIGNEMPVSRAEKKKKKKEENDYHRITET